MSVYSNPTLLTEVKNGIQFEIGAGNFVKVLSSNKSLSANTVSQPFLFPSSTTLTTTGITAHAGGGQQTGSVLTTVYNSVATVATAADSVTLPAASLYSQFVIYNGGAAALAIFPYTSGTINGGSANASITLAVGQAIILVGSSALNWNTTYPSIVYFLDNSAAVRHKVVYEDAGVIANLSLTLISLTALTPGSAQQSPVFSTVFINPNRIVDYVGYTQILTGPSAITNATITAHAGGSQQTSGASLLVNGTTYNVVTTVATAADSVTLPAATVGSYFTVLNSGTNSLNIFAFTSGTIDGGSANGSIALAPGLQRIFTGTSTTAWTSSSPVVTQILYNTSQDADETIYATNSVSSITAAIDLILNGQSAPSYHPTTAAVNSTATATAAQVATGYITSTSGAATTITLPTGTLLGAALKAVQGTVFDLYVDNTAGSNTVTIAVATNGIESDAANTTAGSFGQLTVASGATGIGRFTLMFSSPTSYIFTRTA